MLCTKSHLSGVNSNLKAFGSQDWDLGLNDGMCASKTDIWDERLREGCGGGERGIKGKNFHV